MPLRSRPPLHELPVRRTLDDRWSTAVGAGMSFVRGQVFTRGGNLLASFHQEGMIRAFEPADPSTSIQESARL